MDYSNIVILLARQRSGTNAVRSILESHPDVFCLNEVFNLADKASGDALLRDTNFFNFLETYACGDVGRVFPDNHERLFREFMEYLNCFSTKRYLLVDVKYNTAHFFTKPWSDNITIPYLFDLLTAHQVSVLNLTRKNYLRYVVSVLKAWRSGKYTVAQQDKGPLDSPIRLDVESLLRELHKCDAEDRAIEGYFSSYSRYLAADYSAVFPSTDRGIAGQFLERVASWLGISNCFQGASYFKKQSYLPLKDTIENFDEVAAALRGTKFEGCLQDEGMYLAARPNASTPLLGAGKRSIRTGTGERRSSALHRAGSKRRQRGAQPPGPHRGRLHHADSEE